jgi:uncharacterized flavoprotein (TIGR03862 family)
LGDTLCAMMNSLGQEQPVIAIIGGGPAGLAAAEAIGSNAAVHVFDSMPSLGRKFLLAGKSGLNLTHAEDLDRFLARFGGARATIEPAVRLFPPDAIRAWAGDLGIETFVGSSGRVFPTMMKTSPLLRAWLERLGRCGVTFHPRHRWQGWNSDGELVFDTPGGQRSFAAAATVLATGGASWPRLGSDGAWAPILAAAGMAISPLRPANCGFDIDWSVAMRSRFAGAPVKSVVLSAGGAKVSGDFVVTSGGIEGSAVYALAASLRDEIAASGSAEVTVDLTPDRALADLLKALTRRRGKSSLANHLRKAVGLTGVKASLLREGIDVALLTDPERLAQRIKALPLKLERPRPLAEAISSAGGLALTEIDERFMLERRPGVFAAGEMLDWEAPTGGYLLTACFATGRAAGRAAADWVAMQSTS